MSFGKNDITGAVSGISNINVWDAQGRLKVIGGGSPPGTIVWGSITGLVTNQTDLINYLGLNFYPLSTNPAGYLTDAPSDGSTYGRNNGAWTIVTGSGTLLALPFTTDHITATSNPYVVGDVVYYLGNVYRCIANNDSILPTNVTYWTLLGAGNPLVQQPADWNSTSGNNQILNKPTIPSAQGLQDVITTDPVLTTDNTIDAGGFTQTFDNNYKFNINAEQLIGLTVNDGTQSVEFNLYPQAGSTTWAYDDGAGNRTAIEMSGVKMYIQTPGYASASNGDVLTLIDNGNGQVEFQTPGTTTGDSLSPLLLMGG